MAQAIPYLAFDGNCAEAMRFYESVLGLGAKLEMMVSGGESPVAEHIPPEHAHIPPEHAHRIMHARMRFDDGSYIYAGDACTQTPFEGIKEQAAAPRASPKRGFLWPPQKGGPLLSLPPKTVDKTANNAFERLTQPRNLFICFEPWAGPVTA